MRTPQSWRIARLTLAIAAVTAAAFLLTWMAGQGDRVANWAGFQPYRFAMDDWAGGAPVWLTPLSATLAHGDFFHLIMNLLILLVCGRAVEGVLGPISLGILYVLGAYAAAAGHYVLDPDSIVPMIGASGAISAVLGAYAILFGRNKVKVTSPRLAVALNALWLIAAWIGLQLVVGFVSPSNDLNIAIGAHIGGFLIGLALAYPLLLMRYRKA
jgi:membrane associated rhomboid family serine protease